jgi:SAM-dependent methyltransferase
VKSPHPDPLPSVFDDGDAYDLVGNNMPYGLDFYVEQARRAKGPVLDVACGTGRILLPCLQAGVDIEGLDLYEPMLKTLREKAAALNLSPRLHQADMSAFSLPRRFALVMIPFNAFIHNMTLNTGRSAGVRYVLSVAGNRRRTGRDARTGGRTPASGNGPADADVRHAHLRSRRAGAAFDQRTRTARR